MGTLASWRLIDNVYLSTNFDIWWWGMIKQRTTSGGLEINLVKFSLNMNLI